MTLTIEFIDQRIEEQLRYIDYIKTSNRDTSRIILLSNSAYKVLYYFKNLKEI